MRMRTFRIRFWLEAALSVCTGCLTMLAALWPDWVERVFGIAPDHGSGWLEWAAVGAPAAAFVAVGYATRAEWRRSRTAARRPTATAPAGP